MRLDYQWIRFRYYLTRIFGRRYQCKKCGSECRLLEKIKPPDQPKVGFIGQPKNGQYCRKCLEESCILCAWCGESITPGDPITLYTPPKGFKVPEHAVVYQEEPLQLVGCLGWECALTGGDRAGFWHPPGQVYRVLSPTEQVMMRVREGNTDPVIVSDVTDPSKAIPIIEEG